jgi:hypothetical protein
MLLIVLNPTKEGKDRSTPLRRAVSLSCEDEVVNLLTKIGAYSTRNSDPEDSMNVRQNAQVIVNAERYYRA